MKRVVITGMGAISPAGIGVDALWDAVMAGRSCIAPITRFDTSEFASKIGGEIPNFDAIECGLTKKEARRFAPYVQYAIVASDEAMKQSGLDMEAEDPTGNLTWFNEEMDDCANGYATYVLEQVEAAKQTCTDPVVLIEQRVDFSRWVESGFGTADCLIITKAP